MESVRLTEGAAAAVERDVLGKIRLTSSSNRNVSVQVTLVVLVALTVVTFLRMGYGTVDLVQATRQALADFWAMMAQPALDPPYGAGHFTWGTVLESAVITLAITAITTVISGIVSFFLALAASENLSSSIPTILWVLVFTVAIGLGSEAAVLGISFHSIAYLTKSYSESFEEIDAGVIEALRASGASFWQVVFQAIVPATITKIISWTFIRLEINFTNAVAVGAFAGAGGIGFQLYQAGSRYYNLHEVGVIVYVCLVAAFVLEFVSVRLRRRYILND